MITVAVGQFGGVVGSGLLQVLGGERGLRVVGVGLDRAALRDVVARGRARVVVLDEESAAVPSVVGRLCAAPPGGSHPPGRGTQSSSGVGLVVLAHRPTRAYAVRCGVFGVGVCIAMEVPARELVRGIRLAADGATAFVSVSGRPAHPAPRALGMLALTRRERDVLKLLSDGQRHAEVADTLNVSTETARTHAKHIYHKLGVSSRKELLGIDP